MRISSIIITLVILMAVTISGCLSESKTPKADPFEPRVNSEAGIQITLTYLPDIGDATAFDLRVNSHTDYNDDFQNNSYLRDPSGKTYKPISYEGTGGHHANGILRFPKIESKKFELVIQDVADVKERIFKW
ncbi:MAG: hypothetical protein OIN87_12190 [Candidatus Methanoperedens sp.]|nr:hypothetical protein [Candidatus Methanoperedens sp.]